MIKKICVGVLVFAMAVLLFCGCDVPADEDGQENDIISTNTGKKEAVLTAEQEMMFEGNEILGWNKIIDDTICEFKKANPNVSLNVLGPTLNVTDVENGFGMRVSPYEADFSFCGNIARLRDHTDNYYSREGGVFYQYKSVFDSGGSVAHEYEKINLGSVLQGRTLYGHVIENADKGPYVDGLLNILLDTKGKVAVSAADENTYIFETYKDDGFFFWDFHGDFDWSFEKFDGDVYKISIPKFVCTAEVKDGRLASINFRFDDGTVKTGFSMCFAYGDVSLTLPIV